MIFNFAVTDQKAAVHGLDLQCGFQKNGVCGKEAYLQESGLIRKQNINFFWKVKAN